MAGRSNPQTQMFYRSVPQAAPTLEASFFRAYPRLRERALVGGPDRLMALAVTRDGAVQEAVIGPGQFLVIGRHTRCALRLPDADVSLRHLIFHFGAASEPNGPAMLRLWDLRTGTPFQTEDGRASSSVVAERWLSAEVGATRLLFLPLSLACFDDPRMAWASLPERRYVDARYPSEHRHDRTVDTITHTLPPLIWGAESVSGRAAGQFAVEVPEGRYEHQVTDETLARGMLLGRYDRCQLQFSSDNRLSRVHLFVVQIGDDTWAVDTASTNGTLHDGVSVSAFRMGARASLLLSRLCIVRWKNVERAAA